MVPVCCMANSTQRDSRTSLQRDRRRAHPSWREDPRIATATGLAKSWDAISWISIASSGSVRERKQERCSGLFMTGKGRHTYMYCCTCACTCTNSNYSKTVQQKHVKFGLHIAPYSVSLSLGLWHCSSLGFGVENVLVSSFEPSFKCTAGKTLLTPITLHSKVLCD